MGMSRDYSYLLTIKESNPEDLAWDHALDISVTIFSRMNELGISKGELARRMGVNPSQVSRIIRGQTNLTLKTLAKIETALDLRLDGGFRYKKDAVSVSAAVRLPRFQWGPVNGEKPSVQLPPAETPSLSVLEGGLAA